MATARSVGATGIEQQIAGVDRKEKEKEEKAMARVSTTAMINIIIIINIKLSINTLTKELAKEEKAMAKEEARARRAGRSSSKDTAASVQSGATWRKTVGLVALQLLLSIPKILTRASGLVTRLDPGSLCSLFLL